MVAGMTQRSTRRDFRACSISNITATTCTFRTGRWRVTEMSAQAEALALMRCLDATCLECAVNSEAGPKGEPHEDSEARCRSEKAPGMVACTAAPACKVRSA